jgi:phosphatidate cytidylyltransferase
MKNILTRSISGTIYVALITISILLSSYSFLILFSVISGLALWEFYELLEKKAMVRINKPVAIFGGIYLFLSGSLSLAGVLPFKYVSLWFIIMLYVLIGKLFTKGDNSFKDVAYTIFGQFYIALPLMFLSLLGFIQNSDGTKVYTPLILISFFVLIWVYDTGAYVFGMTFGKHRLFERISPKKSWEGAIGGAISSMLAAAGISFLFPGYLELWQWLGFAFVTVLFGTFGDLVESMFKRSLNVKDSGNMIPGHGGLLDRIDSCLLAAPAVAVFYLFLV